MISILLLSKVKEIPGPHCLQDRIFYRKSAAVSVLSVFFPAAFHSELPEYTNSIFWQRVVQEQIQLPVVRKFIKK
jgi:hypothetical protein